MGEPICEAPTFQSFIGNEIARKALIIEQYVQALPKIDQRTPLWSATRSRRIGASELSALVGQNPYCSKYTLLLKKITNQQHVITTYLQWGELLEYSIKAYLKSLGVDVHECGLIVHSDSLCCSPDGIAVINPRQFALAINKDYGDEYSLAQASLLPDKPMILLLEFKSLMSREPVVGHIPKYYLPQVLGGIGMCDICEAGLFIESKYDIDPNSADYKLPVDSKPKTINFVFVEKDPLYVKFVAQFSDEAIKVCMEISKKTDDPYEREALLTKWYTSTPQYVLAGDE